MRKRTVFRRKKYTLGFSSDWQQSEWDFASLLQQSKEVELGNRRAADRMSSLGISAGEATKRLLLSPSDAVEDAAAAIAADSELVKQVLLVLTSFAVVAVATGGRVTSKTLGAVLEGALQAADPRYVTRVNELVDLVSELSV
jgi:hypothetical protein